MWATITRIDAVRDDVGATDVELRGREDISIAANKSLCAFPRSGVRSEGSLSSKLLMCSKESPEGEGDGSKADASRVAAATEDAWQSDPSACAIAGGRTGSPDGAESPNREEAHQASLLSLIHI